MSCSQPHGARLWEGGHSDTSGALGRREASLPRAIGHRVSVLQVHAHLEPHAEPLLGRRIFAEMIKVRITPCLRVSPWVRVALEETQTLRREGRGRGLGTPEGSGHSPGLGGLSSTRLGASRPGEQAECPKALEDRPSPEPQEGHPPTPSPLPWHPSLWCCAPDAPGYSWGGGAEWTGVGSRKRQSTSPRLTFSGPSSPPAGTLGPAVRSACHWLLHLPEPVGSVLAGSTHALAQPPHPREQSATTIHPRTPPPPYLASQQASHSFSNACQLLKAPEFSALVLRRSGHLSPNDSQVLTQGSFALRRQMVCHQRALYRRHRWAQVALCGRALLPSWRGDVAAAGRLQLGVVSVRLSPSLGCGPLSTQRDPPGLWD